MRWLLRCVPTTQWLLPTLRATRCALPATHCSLLASCLLLAVHCPDLLLSAPLTGGSVAQLGAALQTGSERAMALLITRTKQVLAKPAAASTQLSQIKQQHNHSKAAGGPPLFSKGSSAQVRPAIMVRRVSGGCCTGSCPTLAVAAGED